MVIRNHAFSPQSSPRLLGLSAALSTPSNLALRDSWVIDGASHVHVCNMRNRFESIEPCHHVLLTGDNSTVIEGWGIAYAWITKADGRRKKMRMRAAYIPKFYTNLISTILLREGHGIYLDEFTMQLQRRPDRECFAQLEVHHRMTVAEYNPLPEANGDAALATGSNFPSLPVAPPATDTKVGRPKTNVPTEAIGTKGLTSSRLQGNPSDEAIRRLPNIATNVEVMDIKEPNLPRGEPKELNEAREPEKANQQISRRDKVIRVRDVDFDDTKRHGTDTERLRIELRQGCITEPDHDRLTRQLLTPDPIPMPAASIGRSPPPMQSPDAFAPLPDEPMRNQKLQQMLDQIVNTNPSAEACPNTSLDVGPSQPVTSVNATKRYKQHQGELPAYACRLSS